MSRLITTLLLLLFAICSFAQKGVVGKVTDHSNKPLRKVEVNIKDKPTKSRTNSDGVFLLKAKFGDILQLTHKNYQPIEIVVRSTTINVQLEKKLRTDSGKTVWIFQLPESDSQSIQDQTSPSIQLSINDFNAGNINHPIQLIQGQVPGFTIVRPGGDPTGAFDLRIRSTSTLYGQTAPLFVIDGLPQASFFGLDPLDVAKFTILKDAASASRYGLRGGSGVVLIETKKDTSSSPQLRYQNYLAMENVARRPDVLTAEEYRNFNIGDFQIEDLGASTDWGDAITRTAFSHTHHLSLGGQLSQLNYRAALHYRDIQGTLRQHEFQQLNARLFLQQKALQDRLTITANLSATNRFDQNPTLSLEFGTNDIFNYANTYNPTAPIRSNAPEFEQYDGYFQQLRFNYYNPVAILEQNMNETERQYFQTNLRADFEILENLTASATYAQEQQNSLNGFYFDKNSLYVGFDRNGLAGRSTDKAQNEFTTLQLRYATAFTPAQLQFEAIARHEYQVLTYQGFLAQGGDFLTDAFTFNNLGAALDFFKGQEESLFPRANLHSYKNQHKLSAFSANALLAWKNAYFLDATLRREGSSRLGANARWSWFPAVRAAVDWAKIAPLDFAQQLKFRIGFGQTGNVPLDNGLSLQPLESGIYFPVNGVFRPGYQINRLANPDLGPEKVREWNVGLDFQVFNAIDGSIDWYHRRTEGVFWEDDIAFWQTSNLRQWVNLGDLTNTGLEIMLGTKLLHQQNFSWYSQLNLTFAETQVGFFDFNENSSIGAARLTGGRSQGGIFSRFGQNEEFGNFMTRSFVRIDENGQWVFEDFAGSNLGITGNAFPDMVLGWSNQLQFGKWQLDILFRSAFGHDIFSVIRASQESPAGIGFYNILESATEGELRRLRDPAIGSDYHVESGSYLRLDNLNLRYNFTTQNINWLQIASIYLSAQNVFTLTSFSGIDPEIRIQDSGFGEPNPFAYGQEHRNTYWLGRTLMVGMEVGF